jgi:hypothetical protein
MGGARGELSPSRVVANRRSGLFVDEELVADLQPEAHRELSATRRSSALDDVASADGAGSHGPREREADRGGASPVTLFSPFGDGELRSAISAASHD